MPPPQARPTVDTMEHVHLPESKTAWAWTSIAVTVPIGITTLVVIEVVAALLGYSDQSTPAWANTSADVVAYAAILAPLLLGLLGWRESHRRAALGAALLGSLLVITFFLIQG
jgi:Na+/proline symporter